MKAMVTKVKKEDIEGNSGEKNVPKDDDEDDAPKGQKEKSLKMKAGTVKRDRDQKPMMILHCLTEMTKIQSMKKMMLKIKNLVKRLDQAKMMKKSGKKQKQKKMLAIKKELNS